MDPTSDGWTVQCEIFQATLIGGLPQDEDFQPGPDDDDFQPGHFSYFGYGQPGHGPPVPPPPPQSFNPFAAHEPNQQNQEALGWDMWPNQVAAAENAIWPNQLNAEVNENVAQVDHQLPAFQEEQEPEEVINDPANPEDHIQPVQEEFELSNSGVLAIDDDTDASDGEQ